MKAAIEALLAEVDVEFLWQMLEGVHAAKTPEALAKLFFDATSAATTAKRTGLRYMIAWVTVFDSRSAFMLAP